MDVNIRFTEEISATESHALGKLASAYRKVDLIADEERAPPEHGEKGDVITCLTLAGLAVSLIGTVATVVSTWGSKRNYSISISRGSVTYGLNNLSPGEFLEAIEKLKQVQGSEDVEVRVLKGD